MRTPPNKLDIIIKGFVLKQSISNQFYDGINYEKNSSDSSYIDYNGFNFETPLVSTLKRLWFHSRSLNGTMIGTFL
jgi:hypothetical protein